MTVARERFRTDVVLLEKEARVDRDKHTIKGFAVVTKGMVKDGRGEFDDEAIDKIVSLGNDVKIGVKSRFGHPGMSSEALGTYIGRVKDFRRDEDVVRADLHIDKTAFDTPGGNLGKYILDLAESDSEVFGASMVVGWEELEREQEESTKEEALPPLIRPTKLYGVDVVDEPAANNNGLFGFYSDSVKPSAQMTAFLEKFLSQPDAVSKVVGFLNRYSNNKEIYSSRKETKTMSDLAELTVEQLKAERNDLYEVVSTEGYSIGVDAGVETEKTRNVAILEASKGFSGVEELALKAVKEDLSADKALISFQEKKLSDIESASAPGLGIGDEPETGKLSHLEKANAYKKENNCSITDALQATAENRE